MILVEFLRARLDERHARAAKLLRYAQENDVAVRDPRLLGRTVPGWHDWPEVEQMAREVLAEADAKRRIVELAESLDVPGWGDTYAEMQKVLRLIALPYAGHADYREEWKP